VQWLLPEYNDYYRTHPKRWNGERRLGKYDFQCWYIRKSYPQSDAVKAILSRFGGVSVADFEKASNNRD